MTKYNEHAAIVKQKDTLLKNTRIDFVASVAEKYKFDGITLIPMIKPTFQWTNQVINMDGDSLTKPKSKFSGKTDEELLKAYELGGK